jgi:hypothetical protein
MKTLAAIGELTMNSASTGYANHSVAPMDAQSRFSQMMSDPDFRNARINRHHPRHQEAREEFQTICRLANGEM